MWAFVLVLFLAAFLAFQFVVFPSWLPVASEHPLFTSASPPTPVMPPDDARLFRSFGGALPPPSTAVASSAAFQEFAARIDRASNQFACGDGRTVPLAWVNDDVCDCGVDEPGTSACSGHPWASARVSLACRGPAVGKGEGGKGGLRAGKGGGDEAPVVWLPASRINDGLCDCPCDGADEWEGRVVCHPAPGCAR